MKCLWHELISILPVWMRQDVDTLGRDSMQELRLRLDYPPELVCKRGSHKLHRLATREDIAYVINMACRYSPWTAASISQGYLTASGGHRIGICGQMRCNDQGKHTIQEPSSLCVRVARDFPGIAKNLGQIKGSILIIGSPGTGKTTLLRDLIRSRSSIGSTSVVDERGELFPPGGGFEIGSRTDVLSFCSKPQGIDMVLRAMGPTTIAVDEITSQEDCEGLIKAGWCGVMLLATAHAQSKTDLMQRPVYKPLVQSGLFDALVVLNRDQTWRLERICP